MAKDSVQYDAFISYRHSELDSFVAETLHRQLESFKLPGNVARLKAAENTGKFAEDAVLPDTERKTTESVKTRIQRVFRDKEELPLVTNLADPITDALENSEYLIVICSPRLPESMWCRKEIETFIQMHDREHVLAVLVEGEPDTSFPEELLYREVEEAQPDGSVVRKRIPVEPLAADVRGEDHREIRKKIKSELLRLVAPMFDCNYDDLKQRHKEQRTRKILMTSVSISAVCLLFGIVSMTMALRIKRQNIQITAQSEEISAQAQEIEEQYQAAKKSTAVSRSKEALNYLEEGDRLRAVATAQDAILNLSEEHRIEAQIDYPAETVYALSESLYLYENGQHILPDRILEADTTVYAMKLTPKGSRVLTLDQSGHAVIWNPADTNSKIRIKVAADTSDDGKEIAFWGEEHVFVSVEEGVVLYDLADGSAQEVYRIPCQGYVGMIVQQESGQAILLTSDGYQAIDCADGNVVYEGAWDADGRIARGTAEFTCSEDERYWAVSLADSYGLDDDRQMVAVYDTASGKQLSAFPIQYEYIRSLRFDGDRIYVVSNHSGEKDFTRLTLGMEGRLQAFDIGGDTSPAWTYERQGGWLYETSYAHMENSNYLLCSSYSDVVALDKRDGSYIDVFSFGTEVVKLGNYTGSDNFIAFTRDGVWHYLSMERMEDMVGMLFPSCTSTNVRDFAIGDGYCVTLPYGSRRVTVYRTANGAGNELFYESENGAVRDAAVNADGTYLAVSSYDSGFEIEINMIDAGTGEKLWSYRDEEDSSFTGMFFFDYNGQEALACIRPREEMVVFDPKTGENIDTVGLSKGHWDYLGCDRDRKHLFLWDKEYLYDYDLTDMTASQVQVGQEGQVAWNDVIAVSSPALYVVTDKEAGILRFYDNGKEFCTYGEGCDPSQDINVPYIEAMFLDERETESYLYIAYKDGRITRLELAADHSSPDFCRVDGSEDQEKYSGLEDVMRGYRYEEGDEYALMWGISDAYLLTEDGGDILAHVHGFLAYDSVGKQLYLVNSRSVYRTPIYDLKQINDLAAETLLSVQASH